MNGDQKFPESIGQIFKTKKNFLRSPWKRYFPVTFGRFSSHVRTLQDVILNWDYKFKQDFWNIIVTYSGNQAVTTRAFWSFFKLNIYRTEVRVSPLNFWRIFWHFANFFGLLTFVMCFTPTQSMDMKSVIVKYLIDSFRAISSQTRTDDVGARLVVAAKRNLRMLFFTYVIESRAYGILFIFLVFFMVSWSNKNFLITKY